MLRDGESLPVTVTGSCMAPLLREGQRLLVQKQGRYRIGDILLFPGPGEELLVHRYLGPAPGGRLMTKADAGEKLDVLVQRRQVLGRVLTADGVAVAVTIASRIRTSLQYIGWLGKLALARIQRQNALRLPVD